MNISNYLSKQLQVGEDVVHIVRRHPATMVPSVGVGALLVILDFFLIAWWFQHGRWGSIGFMGVLVIAIWCGIRGMYLWSNNILAITTQRVIDIDQRGVFERHVAEATYDKIQDVRYTIRGLWPTIFRFGTVVLQTAGSTTNLELNAVRRPMDVQQLITEQQRLVQDRPSTDVTAEEFIGVVDRLKAEIGEEGIAELLRRKHRNKNG